VPGRTSALRGVSSGLLVGRRRRLALPYAGKRQLGKRSEPDQATRQRGQPSREQQAPGRHRQSHGMMAPPSVGYEDGRLLVRRALFEDRRWHQLRRQTSVVDAPPGSHLL